MELALREYSVRDVVEHGARLAALAGRREGPRVRDRGPDDLPAAYGDGEPAHPVPA